MLGCKDGAARILGRATESFKAQQKKPTLKRLSESIPWEPFLKPHEMVYSQEPKSNAARNRIDPLILFKMLVMQQLFNFSDEELEV